MTRYKSIANVCTYAKYRLSLMYMKNAATYSKGLELCHEAAESGNTWAMIKCAIICLSGSYNEKDAKTAYGYFVRAAKSGSQFAKMFSAMCIERGCGTPASRERAIYYYKRAAACLSPQALYRLGKLTEKEDTDISTLYMKKAAYFGSRQAENELLRTYSAEDLYKELFGIDKHTADDNPASENDADALFSLGLCAEHGLGMKRSMQKACDFYRRSADLGNADAMFRLCMMYESGNIEYDGEDADHMCISAFYAGNQFAKIRQRYFDPT